MNNSNDNARDDDTVPTAASSFVHVDASTTDPLSLVIQPRHDTIGINAVDTNTNQKYLTDHVCITVTAQEMQEDDERAPVDIQVALDVSGSMATRGKLELCKTTLQLLVRFLQPQDRFGLITYSSDARIDLPLQHMTPDFKHRCLEVIRNLTTRGNTNISAAVGMAAQELQSIASPNPVRSILLLTDGHANGGICDPEGLVQLVTNSLVQTSAVGTQPTHETNVQVQSHPNSFMGFVLNPSDTASTSNDADARLPTQLDLDTNIPISLHTFGYGTDHNEELLQNMANATEGGTYYFVEDDKSVGVAFGDAIGGVVSVVAQNAVVQVQVPPAAAAMGVKIDKIHHDQAMQRDDGSFSVTLGDFYAEESRDVVMSVQLAVPGETNTDSSIAQVMAKLRYTDTLARRPVETCWSTAYISRPQSDFLSEENVHVASQWLRVFGVQQMAQADAFANANDFVSAQTTLNAYHVVFEESSAAVRAHQESVSMFEGSTAMMRDVTRNKESYKAAGSKQSKMRLARYRMQRAAVSTAPSSSTSAPEPYETNYKKMWRAKFFDGGSGPSDKDDKDGKGGK